jgi:vacuolar protein 8
MIFTDELKSQLLEMGVLEFLIPLTNSPSGEVQGNAAAAIGNLSSKDNRIANDDYSHFNDVWEKPEGGMHDYLHRFLISPDGTFQHIAVWTIVQLLESGGAHLSCNSSNLYSVQSRPSVNQQHTQLSESHSFRPRSFSFTSVHTRLLSRHTSLSPFSNSVPRRRGNPRSARNCCPCSSDSGVCRRRRRIRVF